MICSRLIVTVLLVVVCASVEGAVFRNVSIYENDDLGIFVATGVKVDIEKNGNQYTGTADALQLAIAQNQLRYLHFAGSGYKDMGEQGNSFTAAAFGMYIQFVTLVQYTEVNNVPGYQLVGDLATGTYSLLAKSWVISKNWVDYTFDDGSSGKVFKVTFATEDNVFNFTVTYAGRDVTVDGVPLNQDTGKIGFNINYPYNVLSSSTSQVALVAIVVSAAGSAKRNETSSTHASINVSYGEYQGFINFESTADAWDSSAAGVKAGVNLQYSDGATDGDVVTGWEAGTVVLSYLHPKPATISHDPEIGASMPGSSADASTASVTTLSMYAVAIFACLAVIFF